MRRLSFIIVSLLLVMAFVTACTPTATPTAAPTTAATTAPKATDAPTAALKATDVPTTAPNATTAPTVAATTAPTGMQLPVVNPLEVKGDIITAGSSTVYPLSEAIAVLFRDEGYKDNLTIDSIGSGAGLERFCKAGETDIANSSRAIKSTEVDSCKAIGREPIAFRIGTDGLAVVVSKQNTFLKNVTLEQLAKIFSTASVKWSDVDPSWPNEDILRFSPGTDSGTFDYFVEVVLAKDKAPLLDAANLQLSEDDNVLVQGVEGSPYAIGYFGYAYYQENADRLNVLSINDIAPTKATVDSATYPLARPLFLYTTAKIMQEKPQVAAFINYYLTNVNSVISKVGYFPANDQALDESRTAWLKAMGH